MAKLKYSLFELNGYVLFTIYDMDERFRAGDSEREYKASNGLVVKSSSFPDLDGNRIYLRGRDTAYDNTVCKYPEGSLPAYIDPQTYISEVHEALREWAEKWEGWRENEKCRSSKQDDIIPIYEV